MNRQLINVALRIIKESVCEAKPGVSQRKLSEEWGIGHMKGGLMVYTEVDRQELRKLLVSRESIDPDHGLPTGTRTEVVKGAKNEKLARPRDRQAHVWLSSPRGRVIIDGMEYAVPPNGYIAALATAQVTANSFVVVENKETFTGWQNLKLPQPFADGLLIYRGDKRESKGAKLLLERLSSESLVAAFADFDPAGLLIALTTPKVSHAIIPDASVENLNALSNKSVYAKQHREELAVRAKVKDAALEILQVIHDNALSVSQESMVAHKIKMKAMKIQV